MAAIISGTIFNDVNKNSIYNPGDPAISGVIVTIKKPDSSCQNVTSDANGNYSFNNLTQAGSYTIYETVSSPNGCPPTNFTQPNGFNSSTTQRTINLTVTQAQIDNNQSLINNNFGHMNVNEFGCQTEGLQSAGGPSTLYNIDLVTGTVTSRGGLTPSAGYNAIGYNVIDGLIYGNTGGRVIRINNDQTVDYLSPVPNLPVISYVAGDVNLNGWLYLYNPGDPRFYVVDVNPNSGTFLQLIDPATGLVQTSNFGVPISVPSFIADWAFNPVDGQLYAPISNSANVVRINPITGVVTTLTSTGLPGGIVGYGAVFFDAAGVFYVLDNTTGKIYRTILTNTTASSVLFSQAVPASANDGARCPLAYLGILDLEKSVDKAAALPGQELTYTVKITNKSSIAITGVVFTDPIPNGTGYILGSSTLNGLPTTGDPINGINVGTLQSGQSAIVSFKVRIGNTIPNPNPIVNVAYATYDNGTPIPSNEATTIVFDNSRGVEFI